MSRRGVFHAPNPGEIAVKTVAKSFLVALILIFIVGCTHTHRNIAPEFLNEVFRGRQVHINTLSGPVCEAEKVVISADSVNWSDRQGLCQSIAISNVIDFKKRSIGRGALDGLFFGVLGGSVAGWIKGKGEGDTRGYVSFTAEEKARWVGFVGAISGGGIRGHHWNNHR
jgi:hypothetical protein